MKPADPAPADGSPRRGSRLPGLALGLALLALAVLPAVPLAVEAVRGVPTTEFLPWGLFVVLCRGLLATLGLVLLVLRPDARGLAKLGISLAVTAFLVLGLEVLLRVATAPVNQPSGWRSKPRPLQTNELGYRGQSIAYGDDDLVVVLLGDSQVEAEGCATAWMPERRLQRHLAARAGRPVKVFTLGAFGYGQDQQLLALREFLALHRADLVVTWLTPTNDLWNNLFPTHWPANGTPKPTFRLVDGELVGPDRRIGEQVVEPSFSRILDRLARGIQRRADWDGLHERTLPEPYRPLGTWDGPTGTSWAARGEAGMRHENLANEKSHLVLGLVPRSPRTQHAIDLARRLLATMQAEVEARGGRFAVMTTTVDDPAGEPEDSVEPWQGGFYRTSASQARRTVADLVDGFPAFVVPVTAEDPFLSPTDTHLNQHAVDQVMGDLADGLVARGFVPAAPQPLSTP